MDLAREFLEIAERDLEASRLLYKNKMYPQAVFYFAQSVEKANKSMAALTGNHNERYFTTKIRHEAINIHQKTRFNAQQQLNSLLKFFKTNPEYKEVFFLEEDEIKELAEQLKLDYEIIDEIKQKKEELLFISATDINQMLRDISKEKDQAKKDMKAFFQADVDVDEWLSNIVKLAELLPENSDFKEVGRNLIETWDEIELGLKWDDLKPFYDFVYKAELLSISLYYLSVITLPNSSISRYPENGESPLDIFTRKLPQVRKLPNLMKVQLDALRDLREFYFMWKNFSKN